MGWKFYAGVTLMLVGLGLMAYPDPKPCVDCDDEVTTEPEATHIDSVVDDD
jgi:hypothetical protein